MTDSLNKWNKLSTNEQMIICSKYYPERNFASITGNEYQIIWGKEF